MHDEIVPVELGIALVTDYDAVRDKYFPYCGDALDSGRDFAVATKESARVIVCNECYRIKIEWQEDMSALCRGETNIQEEVLKKWNAEQVAGEVREPRGGSRDPQP
ncbi:MAG: hypothetical protein K9N51_12735 [Candidatus Pacebacteria bacterium]|nr:hypothetical protein [Candidatus Paceibacterota bacterium]